MSRTAEPLTVLVPAGGSLSGRGLGPAPPLHSHPLWLPAGSGLAIEQISRFHAANPAVAEILVVVNPGAAPAPQLRALRGVRLLEIPEQPHIGGSIAAALAAVRTNWVQVNPITTLPSRAAAAALQVQIGDTNLLQDDWSALQPLAGGGWRFLSKQRPSGQYPTSRPFTGVLTAPTTLLAALLKALPAGAGADLLNLAEPLVQHHGAAVVTGPWYDLGHRASVAASRRSRLPSRAFNRLHHCPQRDAIVKHSSDGRRLAAERAYLEQLPPPLRRHFPALLPPRPGEEQALVMEAIPFPSLAELFLHWRIGANAWIAILERLTAILADFAAARPPQPGPASWLYSGKLQQRWARLQQLPLPLEPDWCSTELQINGRWYPSLERTLEQVLIALEPLEANSRLQLIHGDLCFNNILCDPLYTTERLIDPRGEAPPAGLGPIGSGDSRYDLIKLNHSIAGLYDATVNNLFALQHRGQRLELQLYAPPDHRLLQEAFEQLLLAAVPAAERRTLTASLFLSMLPLHAEDPARLLALAATGVLLWHGDLERAVLP